MKSLTTFLSSERGIALPMALGVMMILSIMLVTVIAISSSSERTAERVNADQKAMGLAEAAVDRAASVLITSTDPSVSGALTNGSESLDGGTSAFSGSLSGLTWTITGTGTVQNPVAGGAAVNRTVTRQLQVTLQNTVWEWVFADQPSGCMTIRNNASFATPLWNNGNVCISNNANYTAPRLYVGGTLTNSGNVGSAGTPIQLASVVGGCTGGVPNPHPCTSSDRVWATTINQTASTLTKPPVNLANWYSQSKPGPAPGNGCTVGSIPGGFDNNTTFNRSRPAFDLSPASSYNCEFRDAGNNLIGQLTWNSGTNTLTVAGTIFFDGNITHTGTIVYSGRATIYAAGTITLTNDATICGIAGCTNGWDTNNNVLMFVAGSSTDTNGVLLDNNSQFQGALYAVNNVYLDNNSSVWGPIIARSVYVDNNANQYKAIVRLSPGAPGIDTTVQPVGSSWRG